MESSLKSPIRLECRARTWAWFLTWNSSADADDVDEFIYMETVIIIVNIASLIKWNWIRSGMQVWQFTFLEITCDANEPDNNVNVED